MLYVEERGRNGEMWWMVMEDRGRKFLGLKICGASFHGISVKKCYNTLEILYTNINKIYNRARTLNLTNLGGGFEEVYWRSLWFDLDSWGKSLNSRSKYEDFISLSRNFLALYGGEEFR